MKGISRVPSQLDLREAYDQLQSAGVNEDNLCSYFAWCRFDPRLAEILVAELAKSWRKLNPFLIYSQLLDHPWRSALGVLAEECEDLLAKAERREFRIWKQTLLADMQPADGEQFWIGVYKFAGHASRAGVERSTRSYLRWGYYGSDILRNKSSDHADNRTRLKKSQRQVLLKDLANTNKYFSLKDYISCLESMVSTRVAELDLAEAPFLKRYGQTKGRVYKKK